MGDEQVKMQASDGESQQSVEVIDPDLNILAEDLLERDQRGENQHVTIDNTWNHKRLISNIDTQTINSSKYFKASHLKQQDGKPKTRN